MARIAGAPAAATATAVAETDGEAPPAAEAAEAAAAAAASLFLFLAAEFFWAFERFTGTANVWITLSITPACTRQGRKRTQELLLLLSGHRVSGW